MKNIVIITNSFPPQNIVGALRPFRLAKFIDKLGWNPIIVTRYPNPKESLNYSLLNELSNNTQIHYIGKDRSNNFSQGEKIHHSSTNIHLPFSGSYVYTNNFINRIIGNLKDILNRILVPDVDIFWVPFYLKKILRLSKERHELIILTTSPPHSIHFVGHLLSKIKKVTWITDFRDPWDYLPLTGSIKIRNPLERLLERKVIKNADAVISTTETYTKNLIKKHKDLSKDKFHTVTNCFDKKKVSVYQKPNDDKFIISYSGIFYPDKDPFTFFRAIKSWFDRLDQSKKCWIKKILEVQLIGSRNSKVEKVIKQLKLEKTFHFVNRVSHEEAIRLVKKSDLVLISTGLGKKTRNGWLPSKLFEYLGCRIPILALIKEGEMANIIRETNSGYVVTSEDHQQIHRILEIETKKRFSNNQLKRNSQFTFEGIEKYEENRVMSKMVNIIEDACNKKSSIYKNAKNNQF